MLEMKLKLWFCGAMMAFCLFCAWNMPRAHAEPQPALDRALVEKLIATEERQARALEDLVRATKECGHR
jgi:hypothetical protein